MKAITKCLLGSGIALLGSAAVWDSYVTWRHRRDIYDDVDAVPHHRYGLVLGTSPVLSNGAVNHYYKYRIEAAALLYQQGKIDVVVVSGSDNGIDYSEPEAMRHDLQTFGVPATQIVMDKGGERTLDSVLYAQSQGLMDDWLIVSQAFHNQRTLMLAKHLNVQAHAYNARDVEGGWKVLARERFARLRLAWDMLAGRMNAALDSQTHTASERGASPSETNNKMAPEQAELDDSALEQTAAQAQQICIYNSSLAIKYNNSAQPNP